jgi:23S rRNA pseudouridine1911/1915/1917 synthase
VSRKVCFAALPGLNAPCSGGRPWTAIQNETCYRVGVRSAVVPPELEGPLDRAVRALFHGAEQRVSWGTARAWIAAGKVCIGGKVVTEMTARVRAGTEVSVNEQARRPRAAEITDDVVVHVDAHLVVVSKPPGVSTVPYDESETDTLDARVRRWLVRRAKGKRDLRPSLGVVHRLDKETSGLIVFTRTWLAKQALAQSFRKHSVHRKYLAIAHGDVHSRTIRSFFVEDRGDGLRGSVRGGKPPNAREAVTHVERIELLARATLVACRLETGRTHQIRIHLSEGGHPLLGERVYVRGWSAAPGGGSQVGPDRGQCLLEAPRLMLHAAELGFVHPVTLRPVHWEKPLPADMRVVLERLRSV